ncbi:hypothetical protein [Winogradskyella pulchriflava]|uniref:Uncharacterized protein n=1 Tax=Winogradskyella pulchriflava TaxID=1110688 RepID=A0ABV6QC39_9FLAO
MRNLIYFLTTLLLFQSCASFDNDLTNPYPLNESNLSELDGIYEIKQVDYDTVFKKFNQQMWTGNNFLEEIDRKLIKDTLHLDSLKNYKFGLKVLNKKKIRISYIENDTIFRERMLKAKLKKDGFLYLKNKNTGFLLVPYIAGAIDIKRTRLSKSEDGNLIFDYSHHRSGAFLIIAFLDGRTWKNRLEYKRIE